MLDGRRLPRRLAVRIFSSSLLLSLTATTRLTFSFPSLFYCFSLSHPLAGSGGGGAAAGGEQAAGSVVPQLRRQQPRGVHDPLRRLRPRVSHTFTPPHREAIDRRHPKKIHPSRTAPSATRPVAKGCLLGLQKRGIWNPLAFYLFASRAHTHAHTHTRTCTCTHTHTAPSAAVCVVAPSPLGL
jgi:hypothetical protein